MSIERCKNCEELRDTDFVSECKKCVDEYIKEFLMDLHYSQFDEALRTFNRAKDVGIDLTDEAESDEDYQKWLKEEDYILSQHELGGCKDE